MSPSTKKLASLVKKCLRLLLDPSTTAGAPAAAPHHEEEEKEFKSTLSSSSRSSSYSCFRRRSSSSSLFDVGSSSPAASNSTRTVASWDYYTDSPKLRSWRNSYDSHDSSWTNVEEEEEEEEEEAASDSCCPWDVPHGCLAVYVGGEQRRFVIQTEFLHHSLFRTLLAKSEEEFGFDNPGGLRIACEPDVFQRLLCRLEQGTAAGNHGSSPAFLINRENSSPAIQNPKV
jgi:SAUR family protein